MKQRTRDRLLAYLSGNPGSTSEEMASAIGLSNHTVRSMLKTLTDCNVVHISAYRRVHRGSGAPIRMFSIGPRPPTAPGVEGGLNSTERYVLDFITRNPGVDLQCISKLLKLSMSAVRKHTRRLRSAGYIHISSYDYDSPRSGRKPARFTAGPGEAVEYAKVPRKPRPARVRRAKPKVTSPRKNPEPKRSPLPSEPMDPISAMLAQMGVSA